MTPAFSPNASRPVHQLSAELLESTFSYLSQPINDMVTAQVCQYWRDVTLNSPRLWTQIHMDGWLTEGGLRLVRAALARSQPHPVRIRSASRRSGQSEEALRLWEDILAQASRFEEADLVLPFAVATKLTEVHAPELRKLRLGVQGKENRSSPAHQVYICAEDDVAGEDEENEDIIGPEFPLEAPQLTVATLVGAVRPLQITLPYAQLTDLKLLLEDYDDSLRDIVDVIQPCQSLVHLTLCMAECCGLDAEPLTLPALQTLDVNDKGTALCRYLTAPSLHEVVFRIEHCVLEDDMRYVNWELNALLRLALRCGSTITSLTLRIEAFRCGESADVLDRVLRALPGLTEVETWEGLGDEAIAERSLIMDGVFFRAYDPNDPFLPNLARLSMHTQQSDWLRDNMEDIKAMVESRRAAAVAGRATLQMLELDQQTNLWPDDSWQNGDAHSIAECRREYLLELDRHFEWMLDMRETGLNIKCNLLGEFVALRPAKQQFR